MRSGLISIARLPTMDVVLEITDTFIGDYLYATLHPAKPAPYDFPSFPANATGGPSEWTYRPSTQLFQLEPSKYAYMSAWPRDNIYRQAFSLFMVTWYVYFNRACLDQGRQESR